MPTMYQALTMTKDTNSCPCGGNRVLKKHKKIVFIQW